MQTHIILIIEYNFLVSSLKKIHKLAVLSLLNGLRLHKDSIKLYEAKSYPTSFALSILAQEEIGKYFLLKETIYQDVDEAGVDVESAQEILNAMRMHRVKQGWFSRLADDIFKYRGKRYPRIIREISTGKLDAEKQNALYVGVTRTKNKLDLIKGRVINPVSRIKDSTAQMHITRVNDFLIEMIESSKRCISGYDLDDEYEFLTMELVFELENTWPKKSKESVKKLLEYRKHPIDPDC